MSSIIRQISDYVKQGRTFDAEKLAWELYNQNKKDFISIKTLATTLIMQQKFAGALNLFLDAYDIKKNDYDVLVNIAHLFLKFDEYEGAYNFAKMAIELDISPYHPYVSLSEVYLKKRRFEKAYQTVIELQKRVTFDHIIKNHQTMYMMLDIFLASGNDEEALKFINLSYEKNFVPEIFYYHASLDAKYINDSLILKANNFIKESKFENHIQKAKILSPVYFGLGKANLKNDQTLSDMNFMQANEEVSETQRYRPLENQVQLKKIKLSFENYLPNDFKDEGEDLIFITGMPRSGTTLLESILHSSGEVFSGGELNSIHELFSQVINKEDDDFMKNKFLKDEELGETYLRRVRYLSKDSGKKYILDKLPGNFNYIGFIKKRFPKAKILYIKRDPWDNAISLYQQFYVQNIPYASTFFNIAVIYADHEEIIRYWQEDAKIDFLSLDYETLVSDTKNYSKKIFEFCGFNTSYNDEKRKGFFSRTASKIQVRGEVHSKSLKKKAFEQQKKEFIEFLSTQRGYWSKKP